MDGCYIEEVRIRWVQTSHRADATFARILEVINNSVTAAEEKIGMVGRVSFSQRCF